MGNIKSFLFNKIPFGGVLPAQALRNVSNFYRGKVFEQWSPSL